METRLQLLKWNYIQLNVLKTKIHRKCWLKCFMNLSVRWYKYLINWILQENLWLTCCFECFLILLPTFKNKISGFLWKVRISGCTQLVFLLGNNQWTLRHDCPLQKGYTFFCLHQSTWVSGSWRLSLLHSSILGLHSYSQIKAPMFYKSF